MKLGLQSLDRRRITACSAGFLRPIFQLQKEGFSFFLSFVFLGEKGEGGNGAKGAGLHWAMVHIDRSDERRVGEEGRSRW